MSNTQVGSVYAKIIDDVINQCRAPFEEEGASMQTLDDFKKTWQIKISERKIAEMPWDPKAPPPVPAAQAPPQPRQVPPTYVPPQQNGEVKVKVEQNDLANLASATPAYTHHNPNLALQNAAQQVKAQFGDAGSATIQQLHSRIAEAPHGTKRPLPQGSPTQDQFDAKRRMTDYSASQAAQARAQHAAVGRPPQQHQINPTQTDGAADWKQMVAERRALAGDSAAADMSIADRVAAMQRAEEGNGVMQPHSKQTKSSASKFVVARSGTNFAGDAADDEDEDEDDEEEASRAAADDPDAINSDLDDDQDDALEDDDDDRIDELMVCTYEKVARVKNKWKCTLKDGILITGGKEYVFGKATGEFEW